jgi:hypothetical protein
MGGPAMVRPCALTLTRIDPGVLTGMDPPTRLGSTGGVRGIDRRAHCWRAPAGPPPGSRPSSRADPCKPLQGRRQAIPRASCSRRLTQLTSRPQRRATSPFASGPLCLCASAQHRQGPSRGRLIVGKNDPRLVRALALNPGTPKGVPPPGFGG